VKDNIYTWPNLSANQTIAIICAVKDFNGFAALQNTTHTYRKTATVNISPVYTEGYLLN